MADDELKQNGAIIRAYKRWQSKQKRKLYNVIPKWYRSESSDLIVVKH